MNAAARPSPPQQPAHGQALGLLGGGVLLLGLVPSLAILGVPRFVAIEGLWRASFGILAIPVAFGLVAVGSSLLARRAADPWRLPWGRAMAVELLVFSALALLALAAPDAVPPGGAGGRIGWALAVASEAAVGRNGAIGIWLLAGVLATLWTFRVGAETIRDWLGGPDDGGAEGVEGDAPDAAPAAPPVQRPMAARRAQGAQAAGAEHGQPTGVERGQPGRIITATPRLAPTEPARRGAPAPGAAARSSASPAADPSRIAGAPQGPEGQPAGSRAVTSSGATAAERARAAARPSAPPAPPGSAAGTPPASDAPPPAPAAPGAGPRTASGPAPKRRPPTVRRARGRPTSARRVTRGGALPEIALLGADEASGGDVDVLRGLAVRLEETLAALGVPVEVTDIEHGPTVARFLLVPGYVERGGERRRVPVARITAVRDDLALALAVPTMRIEAPVAGRSVVGIEIPNPEATAVSLRGLVQDRAFRQVADRSGLALAIGRAVSGAPIVADLERLPHLLIAGATGSGKSVGLAALLASLLFQNTPDALRLVLVDPKRVELARFAKLPHLLASLVTDVVEVVGVLQWLAQEMDRRYRLFAEQGARDLRAYNRRLPTGAEPLPRLVVVIDEMADVILRAPGEVEPLLTRLAQLARATGIHLIVATQRPSADVITGLIKANFPARLAFAVASAIDSRVILDAPGAEELLGRGDLLFQPPDAPRPVRGQGALVTDDELARLVAFWVASPWPPPPRLAPWVDLIPPDDPEEALYDRAIEIALAEPGVNASLLQRRLSIGFPKARAIFDRLRAEGVLERDPDARFDPPAAPAGRDDDDPGDEGAGGRRGSRGDLGWVDDEFDA